MKSIIFGRHAKSSWDDISLRDHDRPLNKRGVKDAELMGKNLRALEIYPEVLIASSALRAKTTAEIYYKYVGCEIFEINKSLYHAPPNTFLTIAGNIPDKFDSAMMIAHNPGITELANIYSEEFISNVPTGGIFIVKFKVNSWKEISTFNGILTNFLYPKLFKK